MAESDATAMKETLRAQQQLLQKLYAELDEEREASATAAREAMDMILRLQGEKAAVKMESSHYKRMAEEKIGHHEATLEFYEDLMYQKEMEIASLEFQVMAYKQKLLALGSDFNAEFEFPEELQLNNIEPHQQIGETSQSSSSNNVRRLQSLPPIQLKNNLRGNRKRDRSPSPVPIPLPDVIPKLKEKSDKELFTPPSMDLPRKSVDYTYENLDSYWNEIKRLDEKVKVISDCKESPLGKESPGGEKHLNLRSRRGRSCSIFSQASTKITSDLTDIKPSTSSDKVEHGESVQDREAIASPSCSVNVHDVFEVPQMDEKHRVGEHGKGRLEKWISGVDSRLTKPDSASEDISESHVKLDVDKLKNMLSAQHEIKIHSPKDMKPIVWKTKDADSNAQAELQKLNERIDRLERERVSVRQEIIHEGDSEEHLRLLKDIYDQIKLIQLEMKSWKPQKIAPKKEILLDPLQEAMVYFWI